MKALALAGCIAAFSAAGIVSAAAMPVPGVPVPGGVVQVANGCGPGGHRTVGGHCVSNRRPAARGCPVGSHPGAFHARCVRNR